MIKRLPQFAERHFASLCASAGVVCNGSEEDECGWDFFLQFPGPIVTAIPADMYPSGPEALVQVKSTRNAPLVVRMKLSNALRMAKASQPCFVVLVQECANAPKIYIRHFWNDEIVRTLKRVRDAERNGSSQLHKSKIQIRISEADLKIAPLDWMRKVIEAVKPTYAEEKARITNTVGFEDGFGTMKCTIGGTVQDMLDLHLGLIESLPISQARFVPQRFGITASKPQFEIDVGELFITPEAHPTRLRLQGGSPTDEITVDASLYSASLPSEVTTLHRWRIVAGPLQLVFGSGAIEAKISMRHNEQRRLAELKLFATMADWRGKGPVGIQIFHDNKRVPLGELTIDPSEHANDWKSFREWVMALEAVVNTALTSEPMLSVSELYEAEPWLSRFSGFVLSHSIRIEYQPEGVNDPVRAAIYHVACDIGEMCFLAVVERNTVSDEMVGTKRNLTFGPPKLLDAIVQKGNRKGQSDEIEAAYRAQIARLGDTETLWEMGDLEAFIAKVSRPSAREL